MFKQNITICPTLKATLRSMEGCKPRMSDPSPSDRTILVSPSPTPFARITNKYKMEQNNVSQGGGVNKLMVEPSFECFKTKPQSQPHAYKAMQR